MLEVDSTLELFLEVLTVMTPSAATYVARAIIREVESCILRVEIPGEMN